MAESAVSGTSTSTTSDASDGRIGQVDDFLLDQNTWMVCFLVVDTRVWIPGKHVLVAPDWIERVSWTERSVAVALNQRTIRNSPEFTDIAALTEHDEDALYAYYASSTSPHEQLRGPLRSANVTRPDR